jgi:hypothetical protein
MTKKQSSSIAKRKAFEVARDAETRRFCAILEFQDAHFAHVDFVDEHDDEDLNAAKAAKVAALVDVEEDALDELVAAHIAFRQACEMRPPAVSPAAPARRKKKGK